MPKQTLSSAVVNLRADMSEGALAKEDATLHFMTQFKLTRYGAVDLLDNPDKAR